MLDRPLPRPVRLTAAWLATFFATLAAGFLLPGGCDRNQPAAATPKQAASSFFKAMVSGDAAAAKAASVGDARSERLLEAMVENTAAMRAFHDAMKARFGEQGAGAGLSAPAVGMKEDQILDSIEKGEEKVEGDSATILSATDHRKVVHLKRVNGAWKVDRGRLGEGEPADRFLERTRRTTKAYRDLADEVRKDTYKSMAEARQAYGERLVKAIEEMPPAGR
jgi:hypothetical protein